MRKKRWNIESLVGCTVGICTGHYRVRKLHPKYEYKKITEAFLLPSGKAKVKLEDERSLLLRDDGQGFFEGYNHMTVDTTKGVVVTYKVVDKPSFLLNHRLS